jgi:hypothetical protein
MTRDGLSSLVLLVCVVGELVTGFQSNFFHFATVMAILTALNQE